MDPQPDHQSPRHSLALWVVVTNDLCIRRCRAQSINVTPVNISDEQPPHYFLILLSVALVICVLELSNKQHRPRREKTCLLGIQQSEF